MWPAPCRQSSTSSYSCLSNSRLVLQLIQIIDYADRNLTTAMAEASFWKPGAKRPASAREPATHHSLSQPQKQARGGGNGPRPKDGVSISNADQQAGALNVALRKTKLSGTTMNMRFMMRKQQQSDAFGVVGLSPSSPGVTRAYAHKSSMADTIMNHELSYDQLLHPNQSASPQQVEPSRNHDPNGMDDFEPVYMNVLGRRSFGGFNRHVEYAWGEHASCHGTTATTAAAVNSSKTSRQRRNSNEEESGRKRHSK
jgi:hypothetical protein